jgi:hypothetical protein
MADAIAVTLHEPVRRCSSTTAHPGRSTRALLAMWSTHPGMRRYAPGSALQGGLYSTIGLIHRDIGAESAVLGGGT